MTRPRPQEGPIGPDWQKLGSVAIGPLLVEHCVAERHWNEHPAGTASIGGNNAGFDNSNRRGRTGDLTAAKSCAQTAEHAAAELDPDSLAPGSACAE